MADDADDKRSAKSAKRPEVANPNLDARTISYLKKLRKSGLHGKKLGTVARILITDQIKHLIAIGALKMEFYEGGDELDGDEED